MPVSPLWVFLGPKGTLAFPCGASMCRTHTTSHVRASCPREERSSHAFSLLPWCAPPLPNPGKRLPCPYPLLPSVSLVGGWWWQMKVTDSSPGGSAERERDSCCPRGSLSLLNLSLSVWCSDLIKVGEEESVGGSGGPSPPRKQLLLVFLMFPSPVPPWEKFHHCSEPDTKFDKPVLNPTCSMVILGQIA